MPDNMISSDTYGEPISEMASDSTHARPRIVFMGTPEFAVPSLRALSNAGFKPVAVVTGADKQRGRGRKMSFTAVKEEAHELGINTILQPDSVKDEGFALEIQALRADIIVVVAFRILPELVFSASRMGTFNLHGSLLPRYRGAAPINRAIMEGDKETGVTTFFLQNKVDTGSVILKRPMSISENETAGDIHDRMMVLGAEVVVETVRMIISGKPDPQAQIDSEATPAPKIFRKDCKIDWTRSAEQVHNHIRGLSPHPGAYSTFGDKQLKILRSLVCGARREDYAPGSIKSLTDGLIVSCGTGTVELLQVQQEGRKRMSVADFLRGTRLRVGDSLGGN